MSELQVALIAIGALVVAGVFAYNRLQERRAREAAQRAFGANPADVLMQGAPAPSSEPGAVPAPALRHESPAGSRTPDARVDYVIEIRPRAPQPASSVQEQWRPIQRRHSPRASLCGPDADGRWHAGLQLVSRAGPVGEAELIEFRAGVETMAAALGASVAAPEMKAAIGRTGELDALCAETDLQLVLHVVPPPRGTLAGAVLAEAAGSAGLVLEHDGRFVRRSAGGAIALALASRDRAPFDAATLGRSATGAISLEMDVPHAADPRRAFETMARLAQHLAAACGGSVVDDNGVRLGEPALAEIAGDLDRIEKRLEEKGIAPGSPLAARLFA